MGHGVRGVDGLGKGSDPEVDFTWGSNRGTMGREEVQCYPDTEGLVPETRGSFRFRPVPEVSGGRRGGHEDHVRVSTTHPGAGGRDVRVNSGEAKVPQGPRKVSRLDVSMSVIQKQLSFVTN